MPTYYVANNGSGDGNSQGSPTYLANVWARLLPGDTVFLLSGIYRGVNNMIRPPSGVSGVDGSPIRIAAFDESDPTNVPLIDGQFQMDPVLLYNSSWWILEGFNAKNGAGGLVALAYGAQHNIVRRVVGWDVTWNGNNGGMAAYGDGSAFNLFEDCAVFGVCGRKAFSGTQTIWNFGQHDNNVFRRCYAQHQGSGDDGITVYDIAYNSYGQTYENCIGTYDLKYGPETFTRTSNGSPFGAGGTGPLLGDNGGNYATGANFGGVFSQGGGGSAGNVPDQCFSAKLLGSIAYLKADQRLNHNNGPGSGLYWFRFVADCTTIRNAVAYVDPRQEFYSSLRGFMLEAPMAGWNSGANNSAQNITSVHGLDDILASNWGAGATYSGGPTVADVKNPFVAGTGATLCYRYVDGSQTSQPLWPWPMNERIKAASAMAGRYEGPCLGCVGGRATRVPIDVTADIESIFGPIPSECRGSVGSNPPPTTPPGVPPPPTTFGAGPRGVDIVGKSEFIRLESSARSIFVWDSDRAVERVAFPIRLETEPNDVSEAANAGYALTWLVDLRQTIGTNLAELDLLYAGLDVERTTPYQARVIGNPTVNRELMDTFWGVTEVSGITVELSNADGRLTPLYTNDLRGQTMILSRYDFRTGETIDELYAKISSVGLGRGTITISASSPDLSLFEREVPIPTVTTQQFPKAIDTGVVIPVVFGKSARVPLPYVNDDTTLGQFDYLVGHGTVAVTAVYFVKSDGDYSQIPFQDWAVRTDVYPGLTIVRFTNRQLDSSGRPRVIVGDIEGASRNFARNIQALLDGSNAWGLNGSAGAVDITSFDNAAASLDQVGLLCDGVIREARQAQDILRELMVVRGMRLNFTSQGKWTLIVDAPRFTAKIAIGDGRADGPRNILSAGQRHRPATADAVSIYSIRYRLDFVRGAYQNSLSRTVNERIGRERTLENNFIRDHITAFIVVDYLSKREIITAETSEFTIAQEGRALIEGDLVQVTYLPFDFIRNILEVRKVTKRLESVDVVLAGGGTAGDIPGDSLNGVAIGGGGSGANTGGTGGSGQPGSGGTGTGPDTGTGGGGSGGTGGIGGGGAGGGSGGGDFNDIFIPSPLPDDLPDNPDGTPPGTPPGGTSGSGFVLFAPGGYQLVGKALDNDPDGCDAFLEWHRIAEVYVGVSDEDNLVNHEVRDYQIEVWGEDETLRRTEYTFVPTYSYTIDKNRIDFPPSGARRIKFILRGRTFSGTLGMPNSIWVQNEPSA